jgi:uncharacterized membrane protein YhaH (DUF805 family)
MEWYVKVMKQYADFNGRARRKEYWMFVLFNIIASVILGAIGSLIGTTALNSIYSLAVLIPSIAVGVRRLHDTGKSGWMLLVAFIPVIGFIWLLILLVTNGTPGENQYGANPKEVA